MSKKFARKFWPSWEGRHMVKMLDFLWRSAKQFSALERDREKPKHVLESPDISQHMVDKNWDLTLKAETKITKKQFLTKILRMALAEKPLELGIRLVRPAPGLRPGYPGPTHGPRPGSERDGSGSRKDAKNRRFWAKIDQFSAIIFTHFNHFLADCYF